MSDHPSGPPPLPGEVPPGPGYWKASDGNWYPPQPATPAPPTPTPTPTPPPPGMPSPGVHDAHAYGQAQVYGAPRASNGFATAALVLGILSMLLFWTFGVGIVMGILAVVFGIIGRSRAKEMAGTGNGGQAMAGIITGVFGALAGVAFIVLIVAVVDDIEFDTDPSDGFCDTDRIFQDPDC